MPAIGVGIAIGVAGLVVRQDAAPARTLCQVNAQVQSLMQSVSGKVGPLSGLPTKAVSCAALDLRYDLGLAAALLGLVIVAAGFARLMRRSRRAALAGTPWPIRRTMDATARWLDRRLPGGRTGTAPRLRGGFLAVLGAIMLAIAVSGAVSLWNNYERSRAIHTYEVATAGLAAAKLPPTIQRGAAAGAWMDCGSTVCAASNLNPPQIEPTLRRLLHGGAMPAITNLIPCVSPCPLSVVGHYDGTGAIAIAFWKLVIVRDGIVPRGAIPARRGVRPRRGVPYAYFLGTDVSISTIDPRQNDDD